MRWKWRLGGQNPAPRPLADLGWQGTWVWWPPQSFSHTLGLIPTLINLKIIDSFVAWMHLVFDQYLRAKTSCPEISLKELHKQMVIKFVCDLLSLSQHSIQGESLLSTSSRWWWESDWGDTWGDCAWKGHGLPRKMTCVSRMISSGNAWLVLPWSWPCIYVLLKFLSMQIFHIYFFQKILMQ